MLSMITDGHVVKTENLVKVFDAIAKIKKKKDGQCEENIELSVEEFDLDKDEVLTSLNEGGCGQ